MDDDRTGTPPTDEREETPEEAQKYLSGLTLEETFHIGQSLGRVLERLDTHADRIDAVESSIGTVDEKVSVLLREFGHIKKAWWVVLIVFGYFLEDIIAFIRTLPPSQQFRVPEWTLRQTRFGSLL